MTLHNHGSRPLSLSTKLLQLISESVRKITRITSNQGRNRQLRASSRADLEALDPGMLL